jgi:hypothetical protein
MVYCPFLINASAHPLVKAVWGDQAPAVHQGIAERGLRRRRLRPCVDHFRSAREILRP